MKARTWGTAIAVSMLLAACAPYTTSPPEPVVPTPTTASYSEPGTVRSITLIGNEIRRDPLAGPASVVSGRIYRIEVLTDRGELRTFDYSELHGVQVGERVRIHDGKLYRG